MAKYYHLLDQCQPEHYKLHLKPDRDKRRFSGSLELTANIPRASKKIRLHQHGLKVSMAIVGQETAGVSLDDNNDQLVLTLARSVQGKQNITLEFSGMITDSMNGIYPCTYNFKGDIKTLIGTQLESHHARELFPCVDEPSAKATFQLTLDIPKSETAISNTTVSQVKQLKHVQRYIFETTPRMSSYLLAFVYGEIDKLTRTTTDGITVNTWATAQNVDKTAFALDVAVKSLEFFSDYFEIPFPLAKCDHIALPDFAAGAMENWGCITYRESQMLVDTKETSQLMKQLIAVTVAHEVAHQWFGNLVTMKWWTDLWLNEGFASWISIYAVDRIFPEWQLWDDFVADDFIRAMDLDSLSTTHAVEVPIDNPDEIRSIFDAISYSKGAALLRMLHGYMGDQALRRGLQEYMRRHAYGNASTEDLWQALQSATDLPVGSFMSRWTKQPGFPYISAGYSNNILALSQQRFAMTKISDQSVWPIPLYCDNLTFDNKTESINLTQRPLKLNRQQFGLYLVVYDDEWQTSIDHNFVKLDISDRTGYLYERLRLAQAGLADTIEVVDLLNQLSAENSLFVWQIAARAVGSIRFVMADQAVDEGLAKLCNEITFKGRRQLGYQESSGESEQNTMLRAILLSLAARAESEDVIEWSTNTFAAMKQPTDASSDLRTIIMASAVRLSIPGAYEKVLDWYKKLDSAQLKIQLLNALNATEKQTEIQHNLDMITGDEVKLQEVGYWVAAAFSSRHSRDMAWEWLKNHWDWLLKKFGRDIMTISYFPVYAGRAFASTGMKDDFGRFFSSVPTDGIDLKIAQALETIDYQSRWRQRDLKRLQDKFS